MYWLFPLPVLLYERMNKKNKKSDEVVFLVKNNLAYKAVIKTSIQNYDYILVLEGLKVGDQVIFAPNRLS